MNPSDPVHPARSVGWPFGLACFAGSLLLFLLTLCRHLAPGTSASQLAMHLGVSPFAPVEAPLWGLLMRSVQGGSPALWNATSSVLGALVVALTALTCARFARRLPGAVGRGDAASGWTVLIPGMFAATTLACSPGFWFAATRASPDMLGLLLLLVASLLWVGSLDLSRWWLIFPASLLTGIGCVENATFFMVCPLFALLLAAHALGRRRRINWRRLAGCLGLFLLGYSLVLYAAWVVQRSESSVWRGYTTYWECLAAVFRQQKVLLLRSIPRIGWLLLSLVSLLPLVLMLMPKDRLRRHASWPSHLLHLLLVVLAALHLGNTGLSAYGLFYLEPLVVAPLVVNALWIGLLAGHWWMVLRSRSPLEGAAAAACKRAGARLWPLALVVAAGLSGWSGFRIVDPRHTAWADAYAGYLLERLPAEAVFVTETPVDDLLRLKAARAGRTLHVVSPSRASASAYLGYLSSIWPEPRLRSLVPVGVLQVVSEWFRTDPAGAARRFRTDYYDGPLHALGLDPVPDAPFYRAPDADKPVDVRALSARLDEWAAQPFMADALRQDAPESYRPYGRWLAHAGAKFANNLGVASQRAGETEAAARQYRLARQWSPANPSALLNLADLAQARALPEREAIQAELAEFLDSTLGSGRLSLLNLNQVHGLVARPEAHMQRGLAWAVSGKPALAAGEIRRAMELTEQSEQMRLFLAFSQFEGGQVAEAEETLREILTRDPAHVTALAQLSRIQASRGDMVSARATIARAVEARPETPVLRLQQAGLELMAGDAAAALRLARDLTRDHPGYSEGLALVAHLAQILGDTRLSAQAADDLARAPALSPVVHIVLSDLRVRAGDLSGARTLLERAIRLNPGNPPLLEQLLRVTHQSRDRRLARQVVTDLLRIDPAHAYGNLISGSLHYHDGEFAFAEAAFRASIAAEPSAEAVNSLAFVLYVQGRCGEALTLAEQAVALRPGDAAIIDTRAMALFCLGRAAEALPLSREAVSLDPENGELLLHLALILEGVGEKREALAICEGLFARISQLPTPVQTPVTDLRARLASALRSPVPGS